MANYSRSKPTNKKKDVFNEFVVWCGLLSVQDQLGENFISFPVELISVMWKQRNATNPSKIATNCKSQRQT